jgi:hypothetical protein
VLHFIRGDYVIFDELYGCHPNQPDTGVRWSIDQIKRAGRRDHCPALVGLQTSQNSNARILP